MLVYALLFRPQYAFSTRAKRPRPFHKDSVPGQLAWPSRGPDQGHSRYTRDMRRSLERRNPGARIGGFVSSLVLMCLFANVAIPQTAFAQRATVGAGARAASTATNRMPIAVPGASRGSAAVGRSAVVSGPRHGVPGTRPGAAPVSPPPAFRTAPGHRAPWRGNTHAEAVRAFRREGPWEVFYLRHQVPNRLTGSHRPLFLTYGAPRTIPPMLTQAAVGARAGAGLSGRPPAQYGLPGLCQLDRRRVCLPEGPKLDFRGSLQLWCASRHLNFILDRSGSGLVAACPESDVRSVWLRHPDLSTPVQVAPGACPPSLYCTD